MFLMGNQIPKKKNKPTETRHQSENISNDEEQRFLPHWSELNKGDKIQSMIACVAIATFVVIAISTYVQSCQVRQSLAYADTSNRYTRQSIANAEEFAFIEDRAYLAVIEPKLDLAQGQSTFIIKNFGRSPAYDVTMGSYFLRRDKLVGDTNRYSEYGSVRGFYLPPDYPSPHYAKFSPSEGSHFYLFGRIYYTDIFDRRHCVRFGFEYERRVEAYQFYPGFNDAD
jgi:hypothetical protein